MQKYISWEEIHDAVGSYYQFAVDSGQNTNYIIFTMGTMISVSPEEVVDISKHFHGYTPEIMETWPIWKNENGFNPDEVYRDLVSVWTEQSHSDDHTINEIIKCAYKKIRDVSFEHVSNEITPVVCKIDGGWMVNIVDDNKVSTTNIVFTHGQNTHGQNTHGQNTHDYIDEVISLREYDLMFTQVYAIITTKLELIIIINE